MNKKIYPILFCVIILSGCAGLPVRKQAQFNGYFQGPEKNITLMPIDIKFFKLTAGGVVEQMDEWDAKSDELFEQAIMAKLDSLAEIKINILRKEPLNDEAKQFINEQIGLYRAISESAISHTYFDFGQFPDKIKNFDYTFGPELGRISDYINSDSILFFSGSKTYWTGGKILLATCQVLMGAAAGVAVVPGGIPDWIAVALVDAKTGNMLWFRYFGAPNCTIGDLRDKAPVNDTVDYLFRDFLK